MIVDPFDRMQGITKDGKRATRVYLLPQGTPLTDLSDAHFVGLTDSISFGNPDRGDRDIQGPYKV